MSADWSRLVARTVKSYVPDAVGVPLISPSDARDSPGGSGSEDGAMDHEKVPSPPFADNDSGP